MYSPWYEVTHVSKERIIQDESSKLEKIYKDDKFITKKEIQTILKSRLDKNYICQSIRCYAIFGLERTVYNEFVRSINQTRKHNSIRYLRISFVPYVIRWLYKKHLK